MTPESTRKPVIKAQGAGAAPVASTNPCRLGLKPVPPCNAQRGATTSGGFGHRGAFLDGAESLTNAALGLIVSLLLTWLWLGFTPVQSIGITAVFFIASTVRSFVIRRFFRWVS